jgi:D-glycero-D-manno-heptose 1,7-bisphosphate phosphatase
MGAAVFIDRDGVLIEEVHLLTKPHQVRIVKGAAAAVNALQSASFEVIVVSNQTVIARGLATENDVEAVHERIQQELVSAGAAPVSAYYFCPHHPNATLPEYRENCQCRKPRPGLLHQAASERGIDLSQSFMVGDRITDIIAGQAAGCTTILVQSGRHLDPPIQSPDPINLTTRPDLECHDLMQAANWILGKEE